MRIQRNGRGARAGSALLAALAVGLGLAGCDTGLVDAIDDLRAAAPNVCKDYCEEKLACEWPAASGAAEDDAFSVVVKRCIVDCAVPMGLGAYVVREGVEDLDFFDHVSGRTLKSVLECGMASGAFRCTAGDPNDVHVFGGVVQSMCEDADACLEELDIDQHLEWTPSPEGGGMCTALGEEWLDAEFFLP